MTGHFHRAWWLLAAFVLFPLTVLAAALGAPMAFGLGAFAGAGTFFAADVWSGGWRADA